MPDLEPERYFGFDEGFATVPAEYGIFPHFDEEVLAADDVTITRRTKYGIVKRDFTCGESMAEWVDHPVHTPDEWEQLKAERLGPDEPGRLAVDWDAWARRDRAGAAIQVGVFPFGVFGTVRDLLGVETMLTWFYDHPGVIHDMMDHLTTLWLALWSRVAARVQIDHIHIWEDMSGKQGSLISPAMIEEFMMPCYDRIAGFAQRHGVRIVSVDTDGRCDQLVGVMVPHGITMFFPFEVQAGNDIREFRRQYPLLGIMGGLDKNALATDRAAIDRELDRARWMLAYGGRYVPGFDHLIPDNVPWENMCYAADRLREVCRLRAAPGQEGR
jgi:uroporphyrinogen decarboxylase